MKIINKIKIIIYQINNDEDLNFLGRRRPISVMGTILLALIGTIIGFACFHEIDSYDKIASDGTRVEKEYRKYSESIKTNDIEVQVAKIHQDVKGMAAAVIGIKADLRAFFFGAKFGLENHFEFPFRFGDNRDDKHHSKPFNQDVNPSNATKENKDSVNFGKPSKQDGYNKPSEPSSSEESKKPASSDQPSKRRFPKRPKKEDCAEVKIVILKDTCDCGGIVIDTLTIKR